MNGDTSHAGPRPDHPAVTELPPEDRAFIDDVVASGLYTTREAAIRDAVRRLRRELETNGRDQASHLPPQEWCEQFETWAASHRALPHEAEDSRETIYAGRGE